MAGGSETIELDASIPSKKFYDSLCCVTSEETFWEVANNKRLNLYKVQKSLARIWVTMQLNTTLV
ncbi:MAG: hypothetical protein JSU70_07280 [Phycisphaerales bacterium]|nr:MAG: hypothetical protein JSU70_07280 [Phycisphaerales bacterium]